MGIDDTLNAYCDRACTHKISLPPIHAATCNEMLHEAQETCQTDQKVFFYLDGEKSQQVTFKEIDGFCGIHLEHTDTLHHEAPGCKSMLDMIVGHRVSEDMQKERRREKEPGAYSIIDLCNQTSTT